MNDLTESEKKEQEKERLRGQAYKDAVECILDIGVTIDLLEGKVRYKKWEQFDELFQKMKELRDGKLSRLPVTADGKEIRTRVEFCANVVNGVAWGLRTREDRKYLKKHMKRVQRKWEKITRIAEKAANKHQQISEQERKRIQREISGLSLNQQLQRYWGKNLDIEAEQIRKSSRDFRIKTSYEDDILNINLTETPAFLLGEPWGVIEAPILIVNDAEHWVSEQKQFELRKTGYKFQTILANMYVLLHNAQLFGMESPKLIETKKQQEAFMKKVGAHIPSGFGVASTTMNKHGNHYYLMILPVPLISRHIHFNRWHFAEDTL